jgi:hypothetical protein
VDKAALLERFRQGFALVRQHGTFLGELQERLKETAELGLEDFRFPLELWAQAVYLTINAVNQLSDEDKIKETLEVLRVLWQGRFLALVQETEGVSDEEAERYIRSQLDVFRRYKGMLRI